MRYQKVLLFVGLVAGFAGCASTYNAQRANIEDEGTIIFTRDSDYALLGTSSPWTMFEVTYERFQRNEAGQPVVEIGLRYTGGTDWTNWYKSSPQTVTLSAQCNFYDAPNHAGPIVYSTPRQILQFELGETTPYKVVSPVKDVVSYQLVIGQ